MLILLTPLPQWNKSSDWVRTRGKIINSYRIHCDESNWHEIKYECNTTSFFPTVCIHILYDTQTCLPTWIFVLSRIVPRPLAPVQNHPRIIIHLYSNVLYTLLYISPKLNSINTKRVDMHASINLTILFFHTQDLYCIFHWKLDFAETKKKLQFISSLKKRLAIFYYYFFFGMIYIVISYWNIKTLVEKNIYLEKKVDN